MRKKPYAWISDEAWLNVIEVSTKIPFFLTFLIIWGEAARLAFYEHNTPEKAEVPDYETAIAADTRLGPWFRLVILRVLRLDRSMLAIRDFIKATEEIGPRICRAGHRHS